MSSDSDQHNDNPDDRRLADAYAQYRQAMLQFHARLAELVMDRPDVADRLFENVLQQAPLFRVLHLINAGYSGTPKFNRAVSGSDVLDASLRGLITFDDAAGIYVITEPGFLKLTWWREHVGPVKEHEPFATLWHAVTTT